MKPSGQSPSAQGYPHSAFIRPPTIRPRGRFTTEARGDDLWIFLGPRRTWGLVAFVSLWMCGWAVGEVFALAQLFRMISGQSQEPLSLFVVLFLLVWLSLWTFAGAVILYKLAGELWRWEEIYLNRNILFKRIRIGPWHRDVLVPLDAVREFRLSSPGARPGDWEKVVHVQEAWTRALVVERNDGTLFFLVRETGEETASPRQSIVERTREALEHFRIPVVPLGREPSALESIDKTVKELRDGLFSIDKEQAREQGAVRPTGPKPLSEVIRRWNSQILFAVLLVIGWVFWTRKGGVPSVFFALLAGYLAILLLDLLVATLRGIVRRRLGKSWSPPARGTWKDEFIALVPILLLSAALGGGGWFFLLNIPSKHLGRWDILRRHVYSVGHPVQSRSDRAGNLYTLHDSANTLPRIHKFGSDGKLKWAISVPGPRERESKLNLNPDDGTLTVETDEGAELYGPDGWFRSFRPPGEGAESPGAPACPPVSLPGRAPRRPSAGPA